MEPLENRAPVASLIPGGTAILAGGTLTITGTAGNDHIMVRYEVSTLIVVDQSGTIGRYNPASVAKIAVAAGAGNDSIQVASNVTQPAVLDGGVGKNLIVAGGGSTKIVDGGSASKIVGGTGINTLVSAGAGNLIVGGSGPNTAVAAGAANKVVRVNTTDSITASPTTKVAVNNPRPTPPNDAPQPTLTAAEVGTLLRRAAAASASNDAIISIVDRNGRILGVRTESGVAPEIMTNPGLLVFAADGAVSLARTGAFFGNNQAPLTSRTIRNLSQSTITQREVEANPNITDPNSTQRGPGYVAPVGTGAHFPPGVPNTPEVDLFGIEHTNRDGNAAPGPDGIIGTPDDIALHDRFNINPAYVPAGQTLFAPVSYGVASGILPTAVNRGIATLPGGIPIVKNGAIVGGIGVFFPGKTGYATEENSKLSATYDPTKPDRSLEAEYIAFAAAGGSSGAGFPIGTVNGVAKPAGFDLPFGRIDLVGITLDIFGPGGFQGPRNLVNYGRLLTVGNPDSGVNQLVTTAPAATLLAGLQVPTGWLVTPHDGVGIAAGDVTRIVQQGIAQANKTRAAIRLPVSSGTRMVFAVTDRNGDIVGLYRMADATVFSIDVAVAKARNTDYYADPAKLVDIDQVPGVPKGTAFTNRTFRYLALPRFPSAADGAPPGPFSNLRDGGSNPITGLQQGTRLPASAFQSVYGHDSFYPGTNFHETGNLANQNGIVFFPGSAPLYRLGSGVIGGFGVSGDGVDQDDVVTVAGQVGYMVVGTQRADQTFFAGVRLPYQKFDRNPEAF
ncbi:MAG TPA: heme-binding protein [Gemmataceae bacterium]|nr:heme-binding protein [Gemmataceae bacterium]